MSDMTRKEAIENLETLKAFLDVNGVFIVSDAMKKSIDFAIASLETDEAYQLMEEQPTIIDWNNCHTSEQLDSIATTKNDLAQERYQDLIDYFGDEEVAKTILEDKKEFKAWLERVKWHVKRADELARELEQIKSTTKNNLGVDADKLIADCEKMSFDIDFFNKPFKVVGLDAVKNIVNELTSVTPQEPRKGHWIENAEEYYKAINEKGGGVNEDTDFFTDDIACSECLAKFSVIDNEAERFDFCPCCGSDNK